jgi:PPOX class probable F420-dependent enzyme
VTDEPVPPSPEHTAFLLAHRVGHLATVDAQGRPHAVPVCFALLNGRLYIAVDEKPKRVTPERLRRLRNIAANPAVCLLVDDYDEDWSRLAWLQVRGTATLVTDPAERTAAVAALRARYPQYRAMALEERPLLCITPTRWVAWRASLASTPSGSRDRS